MNQKDGLLMIYNDVFFFFFFNLEKNGFVFEMWEIISQIFQYLKLISKTAPN
jgi:hypothetical protein